MFSCSFGIKLSVELFGHNTRVVVSPDVVFLFGDSIVFQLFGFMLPSVEHSKKWVSVKALDENDESIRSKDGKAVLIPSPSLLQDIFFERRVQGL